MYFGWASKVTCPPSLLLGFPHAPLSFSSSFSPFFLLFLPSPFHLRYPFSHPLLILFGSQIYLLYNTYHRLVSSPLQLPGSIYLSLYTIKTKAFIHPFLNIDITMTFNANSGKQ